MMDYGLVQALSLGDSTDHGVLIGYFAAQQSQEIVQAIRCFTGAATLA
jgi:hypothetical protein